MRAGQDVSGKIPPGCQSCGAAAAELCADAEPEEEPSSSHPSSSAPSSYPTESVFPTSSPSRQVQDGTFHAGIMSTNSVLAQTNSVLKQNLISNRTALEQR